MSWEGVASKGNFLTHKCSVNKMSLFWAHLYLPACEVSVQITVHARNTDVCFKIRKSKQNNNKAKQTTKEERINK